MRFDVKVKNGLVSGFPLHDYLQSTHIVAGYRLPRHPEALLECVRVENVIGFLFGFLSGMSWAVENGFLFRLLSFLVYCLCYLTQE
jgi:hypothetical protein